MTDPTDRIGSPAAKGIIPSAARAPSCEQQTAPFDALEVGEMADLPEDMTIVLAGRPYRVCSIIFDDSKGAVLIVHETKRTEPADEMIASLFGAGISLALSLTDWSDPAHTHAALAEYLGRTFADVANAQIKDHRERLATRPKPS